MSDVIEETKWKIPYGITFDKLSKIIQLILRKDGDKKDMSLDSILPVADLARNFLSSNLSFLNSVGIISGDNSKFRLTEIGLKFARALSLGNDEDIKKYSIEIINKSHLNDIKLLIENEGESIQKEKILKLIKTNAKISGDSVGSMPKTSKAGANSLLQWFNKIGLISDAIVGTKIETKPNDKKSKSSEKPSFSSKKSLPLKTGDDFTLNMNKVSLEISSSIDLDDLESAKKHIDILFEDAKKKIQSRQNLFDNA